MKLTKKHPKIKNSSLSLMLLKNYFIMIKEICEENVKEFEKVKICFKFTSVLLHFSVELIYNLQPQA